ncbi:MAG: hypothetical protein WA061_02700 [Microgenomates group bacterium]
MKSTDLKIGEYYRLKSSPDYSWVRVIEILPDKSFNNPRPFVVVKCEHSVDKNDTMGFKRLFRLHELIK